MGKQYATDTQGLSVYVYRERLYQSILSHAYIKFKRLKFFCLHLSFPPTSFLGVSIISPALELEDNAHGI